MSTRLSPLFNWRSAVASEQGPESSTTRHVLLTLSLYMSSKGTSCFPSLSTLADDTGLDKSTVSKHLKRAHQAGWIKKKAEYDEDGNRAKTFYFSNTPVDRDQPPVDEDQHPVDRDQPNTSSTTPSSNNSAGAREEESVQAYEETFPRRLKQSQAEKVAHKVDDMDLWRAVLEWWDMNGYRAKSVGRMLNKYRQTDSPDDLYQDRQNGASANGQDVEYNARGYRIQ